MNANAQIVNVILRRGNGPGLIAEWFDGMRAWADANDGQDASALRTWLGVVCNRPFYNADELAPLWPALKLTLGLAKRMEAAPGANRLANELKFHRLPVLRNADGTPFFFSGGNSSRREFFIVEHVHKWRDAVLTQQEFDDIYFAAKGIE